MSTPTPDQVTGILGHVLYEFEILFHTTAQSYRLGYLTPELLESRLLHTRNLIDFFEHEALRREKDDALSEDFGFPHRTIDISSDYRQRLNKSLSHITYERVSLRLQGERKWPMKETVLPLFEPCEAFLRHLLDRFLQIDDKVNRETAGKLIATLQEVRHMIDTLPEPKHILH